jgi:hypothetical protein
VRASELQFNRSWIFLDCDCKAKRASELFATPQLVRKLTILSPDLSPVSGARVKVCPIASIPMSTADIPRSLCELAGRVSLSIQPTQRR